LSVFDKQQDEERKEYIFMPAAPLPGKRCEIFLSHSSKDKPFVDWLYNKLQDVNQAAWYDKFEILTGDSLIARIGAGLEGSELVIVVVSRNSVESNWVKAELEPRILRQIQSQRIDILPIVLGKVKPEEISIFLADKKWLQFPRKGSDEKFQELLKSIEGHLKRRGLL
jgi:hypothetical protein